MQPGSDNFRTTVRSALPSRRATGACLFLAASLSLTGCEQPSDAPSPQFFGTNYAAVTTNAAFSGMSQVGSLALYYYPDGPKGANAMVWPYVTSENGVVFDKLVVFNGGLSEDVVWKYYPALLACLGNGTVVEISQPARRHIPGWLSAWTNYSFTVLSTSNHFVRLDVSQTQPVAEGRSKRLEVDLDQSEIAQVVASAQTNGEARMFNGVKYLVAP